MYVSIAGIFFVASAKYLGPDIWIKSAKIF